MEIETEAETETGRDRDQYIETETGIQNHVCITVHVVNKQSVLEILTTHGQRV